MFRKAGTYTFFTCALVGCAAASTKLERERERKFREAHPGKEIEIGAMYVGGAVIKTYKVKEEPKKILETQQPQVKM